MDQKMTQNCCFLSKSSRSVIEYLGALSSNQLDSLTTLCDTFVPSIHDANSYGHQDQGNIDDDDSYTKFLQTSASMNGTPQHVRFCYIYTSHLSSTFSS